MCGKKDIILFDGPHHPFLVDGTGAHRLAIGTEYQNIVRVAVDEIVYRLGVIASEYLLEIIFADMTVPLEDIALTDRFFPWLFSTCSGEPLNLIWVPRDSIFKRGNFFFNMSNLALFTPKNSMGLTVSKVDDSLSQISNLLKFGKWGTYLIIQIKSLICIKYNSQMQYVASFIY